MAWATLGLCTLLAAPSFSLNLAPAEPASPFVVDAGAETVATVGGFAVAGLLATVRPSLGAPVPCAALDDGARCDPSRLSRLDRRALTPPIAAWRVVSDVGQSAAIAGSVLAVALDAWRQHQGRPLGDAGTDVLLVAESLMVSTVAAQTLKIAVRRARPQWYREGARRGLDAQLSYPSGHSQATATALGAWASIYSARHPHSAWRFAALGLGAATTGAVAYGRVAGGEHFPTDVIAGALLGASVGWVIPALHKRPDWRVSVAPAAAPKGPLGLHFLLEGQL